MIRQWVRSFAVPFGTLALSVVLASCAGNPQKARLKYLQKGDAYMKQKQYASAVIEYRNALKVDPRYSDAYFALAKAELAQGNPQGGYQSLTQAISVDPSRVDVRIARASLLSTSPNGKDEAQGVEDVKYVLQKEPNNAEAHRVLGSLLFDQHQFDQSLQEFSKAATIAPNESASYIGMARANLALHNAADAELNLKKAIQVDSAHAAAAFVDLAGLYVQEKNFGQAEQTLQAGIKAEPTSIPLYLDLAILYEGQQKKSDADNILTSLSTQLPKSTIAITARRRISFVAAMALKSYGPRLRWLFSSLSASWRPMRGAKFTLAVPHPVRYRWKSPACSFSGTSAMLALTENSAA